MAYQMNKDEANKPHTFTWTKLNDDSRKSHFRKEFIKQFGGNFLPQNNGLVTWEEQKHEEIQPVRTICVINPEGIPVQVQNFTKYCRENDLSRSAMYEVLKGKRKQHKGFTAKGD